MSDTVTIDGVELNVDDLETALEEVYEMADSSEDEYTDFNSGYLVTGSMALASDGFYDNDVYISSVEDLIEIGQSTLKSDNKGFTSISRLEEELERARKDPFEDYVLGIEGVMSNANTIEGDEANYEIVSDTRRFKADEVQALIEDDGVAIGEFRARDGDTVVIEIEDTRE